MRRKSKILLSFFIFVCGLLIVGNLPVIAYGTDVCSGRLEYESYMGYLFPCGFGCGMGGSNVRTILLSSATLKGGVSATNSSAASSSLSIALSNPCPVAKVVVTSFTLMGPGIPTISNWDNNTRPSSASNLIDFNSTQSGNDVAAGGNVSFIYYPESAIQEQIMIGQTFNYVITFGNGQSVSGSLIAQ